MAERTIGEAAGAKVSEATPSSSGRSDDTEAFAIAEKLGRDLSAFKGDDVDLATELNVESLSEIG